MPREEEVCLGCRGSALDVNGSDCRAFQNHTARPCTQLLEKKEEEGEECRGKWHLRGQKVKGGGFWGEAGGESERERRK